jgi:hypothetical protein
MVDSAFGWDLTNNVDRETVVIDYRWRGIVSLTSQADAVRLMRAGSPEPHVQRRIFDASVGPTAPHSSHADSNARAASPLPLPFASICSIS